MTQPPDATYDERLWLPWWAWPGGLGVAALIVTELAIGAFALRNPLFYAAALALATIGLLALCRIRIRVADGQLHVDDAHLPVEFISSVSVLDPAARRELLGPGTDPLAFVIQRPWIRGSVRVDLDDPADPTPYWLISTRRPEQLAAVLRGARHTDSSAAGPSPGRTE
jgi:hypothetical protein